MSVLVVLGTILLTAANIGFWVQSTVLDSDEFTGKVVEVLVKPEAADDVGDVLAQQALSSGDIQDRIAASLPDEVDFLPVLLEGQLHDLIAAIISQTIQWDATREVIRIAIRELHSLVVATLENERGVLGVQGDALFLSLDVIVARLLERLGVEEPEALEDEEIGKIVLVEDVKALGQASSLVRRTNDLVPFVFLGSVLALGSSVALSRNKWHGLVVVGYALAIAGLASFVASRLGIWASSTYLDQPPVAKMIIDNLASNLVLQSIVLAVLGGLVVLGSDSRVREVAGRYSAEGKSRIESFGVGRTIFITTAGIILLLLIF